MAELPIDQIHASPYQPRQVFDESALQELAESIRRDGVQQPVVVRPVAFGYELVMGERRLRASKLAGKTTIPAQIRELTDEQAERLALIENLCRQNLDPIEEAEAFGRLRDRGVPLGEIAHRVHKTIAYVEFRARLLNLKPEYRDALRRGILSLPQACDLARVPRERQPQVFRLYARGVNANEVARQITAMLATESQTELPGTAAARQRVAHRMSAVLDRVAGELGRCYSKKDLELLGWVTGGSIDRNLELCALIRKSLEQIEGALRKGKARQAVQPDLEAAG